MPTATFTPPRAHRARVNPAHADPFYGYGYNPNWPSILSVAHDESDGGRLFMIMDRPCVLYDAVLPLEVVGSSLVVVGAEMVLPVKCRLSMDNAVPAGALWRWPGNNSHIYDPKTGIGPNSAMGTIADFPGPYVPPPPANVISAGASGMQCSLQFDRPVIYNGSSPDDAITFDGVPPLAVNVLNPDTLGFDLASPVFSGSNWNISRQPGWITTALTVPQSGVFP